MVFVIFFYPTSLNGIILKSNSYVITYYGICIIVVLWYVIGDRLRIYSILIILFVLVYMFVATMNSIAVLGGSIIIARFIYIVLPLLLLLFNSDKQVSTKFVLVINEILTIIIIVWNIGLVFDVNFFQTITKYYYSQFNWFTTSVFVDNSKPIFTFGIYSYGAFFYAMLFIFWIYVTYSLKNIGLRLKKRYFVYAFSFIIFQILMRGSTALSLGIIMFFAFIRRVGKNRWSFIIIPFFIITGAYYIYIQDYDWTRMIMGSSTNGFASRYIFNWFNNNFLAVKETLLGIGFTIPQKYDLVYSDSGYVVLFTMGNILLPLVIYVFLFFSLRKNLPKIIFLVSWLVIMLFELALPGLLYPKEVIFIAYFYMSVQAVSKNCNIKKTVED